MQEEREARFWNKVARKYAASPIADMAGYERTLERARQLLGPADRVYEFACGTGTTALRLAPGVAELLATDISPGMIAIAREKAAAQGCANLRFETGTPDKAPMIEGGFDAVLGFNALHLIPDRLAALAGIWRCLKPGGLFISKTACISEMNPLIRLAVPVARVLGKAPYVSFFDGGQIETEIAAAGFSIVERARHGSKSKDFRLFLVARKA